MMQEIDLPFSYMFQKVKYQSIEILFKIMPATMYEFGIRRHVQHQHELMYFQIIR
jgi:hypothetical protein